MQLSKLNCQIEYLLLRYVLWLFIICVHLALALSLLMSHICGVSKTFGEWYQKTNKTEDTNKLTLLAFILIVIRRLF
jgi:hypothetical protein